MSRSRLPRSRGPIIAAPHTPQNPVINPLNLDMESPQLGSISSPRTPGPGGQISRVPRKNGTSSLKIPRSNGSITSPRLQSSNSSIPSPRSVGQNGPLFSPRVAANIPARKKDQSASSLLTKTPSPPDSKVPPYVPSPRIPSHRGSLRGRLGNLNPVFYQQTLKQESKQLSADLIRQARKTGKLALTNKNLTAVPERVWQLDSLDETELKHLDLSLDGSIPEKEERWWEHEPLYSLDLSHNALGNISANIKYLTSLTTLILHNNSLSTLPYEVGQLRKLTRLSLAHNRLEEVPEGIYQLTELRTLNLAFNKITNVEDSIGDLILLEKLDMSHNCLRVLPPGVGFLTRLAQLSAQHNHIGDVPPDVGNMRVLRELDLSHNKVQVLPPLGELRKLEVLNLDHNELSELPEVQGCGLIREMHLGHNRIKEIPPDILEELATLKVLNLSNNNLEEIPMEISNLRSLIRLDLTNNGIRELPPCMCLLPHLSSLQLEGNLLKTVRTDIVKCGTSRILRHLRGQLTEGEVGVMDSPRGRPVLSVEQTWPDRFTMRGSKVLSLGMKDLTCVPEEPFKEAVEAKVTCVDLCKNTLTAVPEGVFLLKDHLTELSVSCNKLTSVPGAIVECRHLHFLDVSKNSLAELPEEISQLEWLREINIAYNKFDSLPSCLYKLPGLEILIARDNRISVVDHEGLSSIPRLATLDLANNNIHLVPPELGLLKLHSLELCGNPFRMPRQATLEKGTYAVLSYLRDRLPQS